MGDKLESLVKEAESAIEAVPQKNQVKPRAPIKRPRLSVAAIIWLIAIVLGALQFDSVVNLVVKPTESKIEDDLGHVLDKAASSLSTYRITNGALPLLLPNPAIRGLVKYERLSDDRFRLEATIGEVTMALDSSNLAPYRERKESRA